MTRKIQCVDDEESITTFLRHLLNAKGYTVTVTREGVEAIAQAAATQFDAVITDHLMPQTTGLELVRHLRAAGYPGKIFVLSGALSAAPRKEYETLKVDAIAAKPAGIKDILTLLEMP